MASTVTPDQLSNPYRMTRQAFIDFANRLFDDNVTEDITPADMRAFAQALAHSLLNLSSDVLTSNQLKGGHHIKATLAARDNIALPLRVVGMTCAVNNTASAEELLLGLSKPAATFQLVQSGGLLYPALASAEGTRQVNAKWVQVTGTEAERIRSYPVFQPEDFPYVQGDAIQYTFPEDHPTQPDVTLLYEARQDMSDFLNPVPTGDKDDPYWKPFAPLSPVTHSQNTDQGTNADYFEIALGGGGLSLELATPGLNKEIYRGLLINKPGGSKGFLGARVLDANGEPCFELVQCRSFSTQGGANEFEPLGGGAGDVLVSLATNALTFPKRQLVATLQSGAQVTVPITELTTVQAVVFTDFENEGSGIKPYTFYKGVVYRDTVTLEGYECLVQHTVTSRTYPTPGPFFARVPYLTLDYGVKLKQDMANLPGKMPRFYAYDPSGNQKSGSFLREVSGFGNNSVVEMFASGSMGGGEFVIRPGSVLKGKGFNLDVAGGRFSHGRDSTLDNVNFYNGTLFGFGTVTRSIVGGSLNTVALDGYGGQTWYAYGTRITCAAGFKLLLNGAGLIWHGTKEYPEPQLPDGVDVSEGGVQIINYVAPPDEGDEGGGNPPNTSALVGEGSAGPGLANVVVAGIGTDNDIAGQGDVGAVLGGQGNVIDDFLDEEGNPVAVSTISTILGSNGCTILGGNRALILRSENSVLNRSSYSTLESSENCGIINESHKCRIDNSLGCTLSNCENVQLDNCSFLFLSERRNERYVNNVLQGPASPGGSDEIVATVLNNGSSAFSDLLQTSHQQLTTVSAQYNGTNWQAQVLRADGSAAGPVRNTVANLNADVAALYAEGPVAFHLLRLTLDRLSTSDVAYANFTFTPA